MAEKPYTLLRELHWRFDALCWDIVAGIVRAAPLDAASNFGGALARRLGPLTGVHKTVMRNLRLAFPEWDDAERRRVALAQWENVGRTFMEFVIIDRIMADPARVEVVGREHLEAIAASGRPAVLISGHFANWELLPAAAVELGLPVVLAYRRANNPYIEKRMRVSRGRYGLQRFVPRAPESARIILEAMGQGVSVALLNDQKYDEGVAAPFFGRPAHTLPAAVRFALRFGTCLQPASVQRLKGARFRIVMHEPIEVPSTGSRAADIEAGVRVVNAFIEARVRERPAEWWWVHRRFPTEVYADLAAQGY